MLIGMLSCRSYEQKMENKLRKLTRFTFLLVAGVIMAAAPLVSAQAEDTAPAVNYDRAEGVLDRHENRHDRRENVRDRHENRSDRREDARDAAYEGGKRDQLEDAYDAREDKRDAVENRLDRGENRWDRRENRRDANNSYNQ